VPGQMDRTDALAREVSRVGFGLSLQDAVHRSDQIDEFVDRPLALLSRQLSVVAHPLELIEDGVLALLPPVIEENVLEKLGEAVVWFDALAIVELREKLDIERKGQHRPCALP